MTLEELKGVAAEVGMPAFAAKQMAQWIYQKGAGDISEMTNLSKAARERLSERYEVGRQAHLAEQHSADGTAKYLFPTRGGGGVETVFIPDDDRGTICVSCQVGCKMACRFCATGQQGFQGQLCVTDILNQIYSLPTRLHHFFAVDPARFQSIRETIHLASTVNLSQFTQLFLCLVNMSIVYHDIFLFIARKYTNKKRNSGYLAIKKQVFNKKQCKHNV